MSVRHALLALLSEGPKYGLQLRQEFEARTGEVWPLNVGQVYTTLQRLERDGLVESDDAADEGPQKGFRHHRGRARRSWPQWLRTPPDMTSPPRDELVIKVLVGAPGSRGRRARRHPGPPALPRRAHAAVDAPERGRGRLRPALRPGRRRRTVPAGLADPLARRGRRPTEASSCGEPPPSPQSSALPRLRRQVGATPMSFLELRQRLQVLRRGCDRGARPPRASISRSTPAHWSRSWAPAVRASAPC